MKNIYLAPLEGVTDSIYRNTFEKYYGGVAKYFTPFISPNSTFKFTTREFKEINPEKNNIETTVPQLLTNKAEHFLWAAAEIASLGFKEINFNLGCPSGTVVAKKKGSGLLYYPEDLDNMLYEIFDGLDKACRLVDAKAPAISIKTRLGKADPEEFYEVLDIYNKYPISELTIHPRVQTDFYREPIRPEFFEYAYEHAKAPLIFNGDLVTCDDIENTLRKYESIDAVMIGRGLIANPELALEYEKGLEHKALDPRLFKDFHNELLCEYTEILSGEKPVLHRMKEFWGFWQNSFPDSEKAIKKIKKSNRICDYKDNVNILISSAISAN
ncbi:MAG: tRNA-dihydrouridine synthase family protein [Pseudobutyrivibrio sp.]|nr:tRNA-dihydrouridine synthase family protein [Pseudobutyrivibrio sp.]